MPYKAFDIVIVPFPFADDLKISKYRPALVISNKNYNQSTGCVILLMITSAKNSSFSNDYKIEDYNQTGLQGNCIVRMKFLTLDKSLIKSKIGELNKEDIKNLEGIILSCF